MSQVLLTRCRVRPPRSPAPILLAALAVLAPVRASATTWEGAEEEGEVMVVEGDGSSERTDAQATSASVTVIAVDEDLPASSDVSTVVDSASGTTVQRLGGLGDWSGVSIRGSTLRQVQVVLDGVPLNPDGAGSVNLSELPLWAFETVEIYRGNAPPELGASPIGGVVHLRTGQGTAGTGLRASYGSLHTGRLGATSSIPGTVLELPVEALVTAELFGTRGDYDYFDDNGTEYNLDDDSTGTRANNDKRQLNTHLRLRLGPSRLRLSLLEAFLAREEGLPGHTNSPTDSTRLETLRSLSSASLEWSEAPWRGTAQAWALLRREHYQDPQGELGVGVQDSLDRFSSLGGTTHIRLALGRWAVPALTLSLRQDRYRSTDLLDESASGAAQRLAFTPSLAADLFLWRDRITISPVLSAVLLDSQAPDQEAREGLAALTPRGGVLLRPWPPVALKANVGRYLRPPDFTELFGDRGAVKGNPELLPERGLQWDVGLRLEAPESWPIQGSAEVGHFWNSVQDMIVMVQNSQRTMVPLNLEDAWVQGVEAALTVDWDWVHSQSNLTRTTSVNLSTQEQYANNQLPRVPTWELYQRTALTWADFVRLGHSYSYTDGNYWDRTNFYRAAPRSIHGAFLRVQPGPRWPSAELEVLNLLDTRTEEVPRNPLDPSDPSTITQPLTDFVGYPMPGRTVMLTLRWESHARRP